jgi:hypothetical protein
VAQKKKTKPVVVKLGESGDTVTVHCSHSEIVPIEKVVGNPRNPNTHPAYQLEMLAKIIVAQGWRSPITVSKRSGFIVRGHGRYQAAILAGFTEVPVDIQDYEDEASEWADLVADNRIAELAEIDMDLLRQGFEEIDLEGFDSELAGFTMIELDKIIEGGNFEHANDPNEEWQGMPEFGQEDQQPHRTIRVHFADEEMVKQFFELVGQDYSEKAKYIWYPHQEIDHVADLRWQEDGGHDEDTPEAD